MSATSVLLIDARPIFRQGLTQILGAEEELGVAGEADGIATAVERARARRPDVTLLGSVLADGKALEALPLLRAAYPETRVIVLGAVEERSALPALRRGARGCAHENCEGAMLREGIFAVRRGEIWVAGRETGEVIEELLRSGEHPARDQDLTKREREVLTLVAAGRHNMEIARELSVGVNTVKRHVASIMEKLDIHSRVLLAHYFLARASDREKPE